MEILKKWFAESVPTNAHKATASIGTGDNGTVNIVYDNVGIEGNAYDIAIVIAAGANANMTAALSGTTITVTLGTGSSAGVVAAAKNTATLIAAAITALTPFTATKTGTGGDSIATATEENIAFTGGSYCTPSPIGGVWLYENNTYYYCSKPCGKLDTDAWQTVAFTTI